LRARHRGVRHDYRPGGVFDLKDFEEVGLKAVERRFGPKDMIFAPGDPDDQLYFVLSGTVVVQDLRRLQGGHDRPA
jgi:CRP-like cAMP-binding protein